MSGWPRRKHRCRQWQGPRQVCRVQLGHEAARGDMLVSGAFGFWDDDGGFALDERERGVWRLFCLLRLLRRKRKNAVTARTMAIGTPTAGPMMTARGVE